MPEQPTVVEGRPDGGARVPTGGRHRRPVASALAACALVAGFLAAPGPAGAGHPTDGAPPRVFEPTGYPYDDSLRLNEVQVVGSHNSYHQPLDPTFKAALDALAPGVSAYWDYRHRPLPEQFAELGVRQIELDVFADPEGGHYAQRHAHAAAGLPLEPDIPELSEPGLKVFHIQELDVETSCVTFVACLEQLDDWSDANPGHLPVMVLVEAKDDAIPDPYSMGFVVPIPFDATQLDAIDAEIRSVFTEDEIISPDDVRGSRDTLEEAVLTDGWPTLGASRGKVMFALDNGGGVMSTYLDGHPSLTGRAMFTGGSPAGQPHTAFMKLNDPEGDEQAIRDAVAAGYLVRTRADADSLPGTAPSTATRDLALSTGAQFVSTDFPEPDDRYSPDYEVRMPGGGAVRCNPISAPDWCQPGDVEDPDLLAGGPVCDASTFTDVGADHPFCGVISWLAARGLAEGYEGGEFRPTATITRQAAMALLYRWDGQPEPVGACVVAVELSDVPADHPFCHEIQWAVSAGIAQGYDDGTFRPDAPLTRQAVAAFLFRAAGQSRPEAPCAPSFPDVPAEHPFCHEIAWAVGHAVTAGYLDGTFRPGAPATRQAMAAFSLRSATLVPG